MTNTKKVEVYKDKFTGEIGETTTVSTGKVSAVVSWCKTVVVWVICTSKGYENDAFTSENDEDAKRLYDSMIKTIELMAD